jgi:hypothetical protein
MALRTWPNDISKTVRIPIHSVNVASDVALQDPARRAVLEGWTWMACTVHIFPAHHLSVLDSVEACKVANSSAAKTHSCGASPVLCVPVSAGDQAGVEQGAGCLQDCARGHARTGRRQREGASGGEGWGKSAGYEAQRGVCVLPLVGWLVGWLVDGKFAVSRALDFLLC